MIALVLRVLKFLSYCAIAYLAVLFAAANGGESIKTLMRRHTNIPAGVKARGDTARRLQELSSAHDVDVLFVGSSHCYRAFDPRIFAAQGLQSFNMGSTSQSPVNSYFLLRQHLGRLKPRLIVFEAYWEIFGIDGAESFLDLSAALPLDLETARMAWATGSVLAWNGFLVQALDLSRRAPFGASDTIVEEDLYVPGGFVERKVGRPEPVAPLDSHEVPIRNEQIHYLREMLRMAKASGAKAMVVVQPMPLAAVRSFLNRGRIDQQLAALAHSEGAAFLDFNQLMDLEGPDYFYDADHLAQKGVEVFDRRLLQELRVRGLLPEGARRTGPRNQARIE